LQPKRALFAQWIYSAQGLLLALLLFYKHKKLSCNYF
jgi:hypothetical protein